MVRRNRNPEPQDVDSSLDLLHLAIDMDPWLFEILCIDYLHNQDEDSGFFQSCDLVARLTTKNLEIKYKGASDLRTVYFRGTYVIAALPETFKRAFLTTVAVKAVARQMHNCGIDWASAVDTALRLSSADRGGYAH